MNPRAEAFSLADARHAPLPRAPGTPLTPSPGTPGEGRGEGSHLTPVRDAGDKYLLFLSLVLAGYALFGKGFAYLGISPLFIGEATLALGLLVIIATPNWTRVFQLRYTWAALPLVLWGIARTLPFVGEYGVDAMRDAVVYGYALFALVVAVLLASEPRRLATLIDYYRRFWKIFLIAIPIIAVVFRFGYEQLPILPGSRVPILYVKEGDVMVHLAAILAFWVAYRSDVKWIYLLILAGCAATIGVVDRAGMLAFLVVAGVCFLLRPRHQVAWRMVGMCVAAIVFLWLSDIHIEIPGGKGREVSFNQILTNVKTMLGADSGERGMDSNKDWRLNWWTDVYDYTIRGKYFWTGKGFGINLADDDGYQLFQDGSLRSPHSAHITFLARAGVPGLICWLLACGAWAWAMLRGYLKARAQQQDEWQALFFFVGGFGLALLVNASFDVYLEGPMGGIWFWCVYGLGLGALWIYQHHPEALDVQEPAPPTDEEESAQPIKPRRPRPLPALVPTR